ncbi:Protein YghO [Anaerolineales bacterium]|nr:Protein YghO [Anaerolineales bacterium]
MRITQISLDNKRQVEDFLRLPFSIYRDIPQWVPPLQMDERARLNPKSFPFYRHSQAAFFIAYEGSLPIGRLAVLDNRPYNEFNGESTAFFYLFECENNLQAAQGMFEAGFDWARSRGLTKILGPKGFTPMDGFGLLVKGFEHRPAFGLPYNPDYYPSLIQAIGFEPLHEAVSGYIGTDIQFPQRIHELAERIQQRRGLRIARYAKRSDLRALVPKLKDLYNGALRGTAGNAPISDEEANALASQMLWFADPKLIKIVMKDDDPVGFLFAYPDVSAALQKTRGRLFPIGWLTLLRERNRTDWLNINGAGLIPEYRGSGGTAILYSEIFKSVGETGQFKHAEVVQIGMENEAMQRDMENFGIDFYKVHRTYERDL